MRTKFLYSLLILAAANFSSCSSSEDNIKISEGYGDIIKVSDYTYTILIDEADTALITNGNAFSFENNKRVAFAGEIMSSRETEGNKFYEIRALVMDSILTKSPLLKSDIDAGLTSSEEEIGNDIILVSHVKISKKYLNINFSVFHDNSNTKHLINLVIDDTTELTVDGDGVLTIDAQLRHNANDVNARYQTFSMVSFPINEYTSMEGISKIRFNLSYQEGENKVSTTSFTKTL